MNAQNDPEQTPPEWKDALDSGDREAFQKAARPHMDQLLQAARHDLDYYQEQGELHTDDFTAEEIVGQTLIHAWDHRAQRPDKMRLVSWLLGTQHRVLRHLVEQTMQYRADKAVSLDEAIPPDAKAEGRIERFQYGHQPEVQITWEDVTPGSEPVDIDAPLFTNRDTFHLDPDTRHVAMMHDEFEMSLPEVAFAMERSVEDTAALLEQARVNLRERQGPAPTEENALEGEVDAPPPPDEKV